jgi:hypothetical protein
MGVIDRKTQLFENIVRLRRAGREAPESRDIAAVRRALEYELGESVSRRLAASLLGVSHTALARWTERGDVPTVLGAHGRNEIPVAALLELYEAVQDERKAGRRQRHVLEPTMQEQHRRAGRLHAAALIADSDPREGGHGRAERRSLAYHRALAKRLRRPMVDEARQTAWKWREQGKLDPRYAEQWEALLRAPLPEIRRAIAADTPSARDLRQTSPFAGMLSEPERRRILEEIQ